MSDRFKQYLGMPQFYGENIGQDIICAVSFTGKPATEKSHEYSNITEDSIVEDANIPTRMDDDNVGLSGSFQCQMVTILGATGLKEGGWDLLNGQGYSTNNEGKLTVGVYSRLEGADYKQIGLFECSNASPVNSTDYGDVTFYCAQQVDLAIRAKTLTGAASAVDLARSWNNQTKTQS